MYCKDCIYWESIADGDKKSLEYAKCRRFPPKVKVTPIVTGMFDYSPLWSLTHMDDWCGEFKPRREQA